MVEFTQSEIVAYYTARVPKLRIGTSWRGPCPVHDGKDENFQVNQETGQAFCHSQCARGWDIISLEMDLSRQEFVKAKLEVFRLVGRPEPDWQERDIEATYDYRAAAGNLVYQVVRKSGKRFMQRRPHGSGWSWGIGGVTPVPFRLPELIASTGVIGITEGEKDALNLARSGWIATCNSGGAGNFKPELVPFFARRSVAIFPDNDEAGRKHAESVARLLTSTAAIVRIVQIPDLPHKGDISDFLARGGTAEDLRKLWREAEDWTPGWEWQTPVPHENDRYLRTFAQEVKSAGGCDAFWKSLEIEGLPTPFDGLTRKLGGMHRGEVYVIGARTGQGKTSLVLQFADTALSRRAGVLLFSMEMCHRDAFQRLAAQRARVDLSHYRRIRRSDPDCPLAREMTVALQDATEAYSRAALFVSTKTAVTPDFLAAESLRVKERAGIGLVIVDHMQLMGATDPKLRSDYEKFTAISRVTKEIAVSLDVPLILVSQVNRSNSTERRTELEMSDLRGSGAIEEDAAGIMLMYYDADDLKGAKEDPTGERLKHGPIRTWLKLAKNRFGVSGTYEPLLHMKSLTRFDLQAV